MKQAEKEVIKSLQDLVKALQEQLANEIRSLFDQLAEMQVINQSLHIAGGGVFGLKKILREKVDDICLQSGVENIDTDSGWENEAKSSSSKVTRVI